MKLKADIEETRFYRTGEIANLLGVSRQAVLNWMKKGWVKSIKIGRSHRVKGSELKRFLDEGELK